MKKREEISEIKKEESFLDKNTLIAVVVVCLAWLSWDAYMRKKYPEGTQKTPSQKTAENLQQPFTPSAKDDPPSARVADPLSARVAAPPARGAVPSSARDAVPAVPRGQQKKEKLFPVKTKDLSFEISSQGMGFKNLSLNQILDREEKPIRLFTEVAPLPFETRLKGQEDRPLFFNVEQVGEHIFKGRAQVGEAYIEKTLSIAPSGFLIESEIKIRDGTAGTASLAERGSSHTIGKPATHAVGPRSGGTASPAGVSSFLVQTEQKEEKKSGFLSFFQPDFLSFFVSSSKGEQTFPIMSKEESEKKELRSHSFSLVKSVAIGSKYFGQAWIEDKSDVFPDFRISFENNRPVGVLSHSVLNTKKEFLVSFKMFIGPKDIPLLKKEQPKLVRWVDFGWFGALSRFILNILQVFYTLSGNWGVSIILLTILVRILLLPAVVSSHRSMEIMKKVHPEIQKVREKFKKDPQRMNQEVMALMKAHRANPLGGCLPMLLQIPVFWALWKALSNSYSLYRSPFALWIEDLSWKDPYYVLPVLMGVFMFIQQKITPQTATNKEIMRAMQILPIVMVFFMINLPSGLVLYMLVTTVFGLIQQIYLNKRSGGKYV